MGNYPPDPPSPVRNPPQWQPPKSRIKKTFYSRFSRLQKLTKYICQNEQSVRMKICQSHYTLRIAILHYTLCTIVYCHTDIDILLTILETCGNISGEQYYYEGFKICFTFYSVIKSFILSLSACLQLFLRSAESDLNM